MLSRYPRWERPVVAVVVRCRWAFWAAGPWWQMSRCVWSSSLQSPPASAESPLSINTDKQNITHLKVSTDGTVCFLYCTLGLKYSVRKTFRACDPITSNYYVMVLFLEKSYQMTYLFRLAPYKNGQHLGEEASQERVERRLILEEAIEFHQQFFIFSQSVVDLADIWCK